MGETLGGKPRAFSLSPESSRPKEMYLPSFRNLISPDETAVSERFQHEGGMAEYPPDFILSDSADTTIATHTGEVKSRVVEMAPKFIMDPRLERIVPFEERVRLYHEVTDLYEWLLDDRGVYISPKPKKGKQDQEFPFLPDFYLIVDRTTQDGTYLDLSPAPGMESIEDKTGFITMRHFEAPDGKFIFEKLIHLHYGPDARVLPFFAGLRYDPRIKTYPFLADIVKAKHYDPDHIREFVTPYLLASPLDRRENITRSLG